MTSQAIPMRKQIPIAGPTHGAPAAFFDDRVGGGT
jgi:hypothetical protein